MIAISPDSRRTHSDPRTLAPYSRRTRTPLDLGAILRPNGGLTTPPPRTVKPTGTTLAELSDSLDRLAPRRARAHTPRPKVVHQPAL